jgi:NADH:ubiquinone oxidoreductase subunit B-like Fe-S oxidoreductase
LEVGFSIILFADLCHPRNPSFLLTNAQSYQFLRTKCALLARWGLVRSTWSVGWRVGCLAASLVRYLAVCVWQWEEFRKLSHTKQRQRNEDGDDNDDKALPSQR